MFNQLLSSSRIKESWKAMFNEFKNKCNNDNNYKDTYLAIKNILKQQEDGIKIYPPREQILKAFEYFEVPDCKVIILGQDPYHQPGQAMGLSFSVTGGTKIPPSLKNIFQEIINDDSCPRTNPPSWGDLSEWAAQGVLLLNTSLTVQDSMPNIHCKQWQKFTDFVISWITENTEQQLVFMLWGTHAKKKKKLIKNKDKHLILEASHPSPLSANRGGWFGCGHFGKTSHMIKW